MLSTDVPFLMSLALTLPILFLGTYGLVGIAFANVPFLRTAALRAIQLYGAVCHELYQESLRSPHCPKELAAERGFRLWEIIECGEALLAKKRANPFPMMLPWPNEILIVADTHRSIRAVRRTLAAERIVRQWA